MARGGYRPGAGRPRKTGEGQAVKAARAAVKAEAVPAAAPVVADAPAVMEALAGNVTPLEYLLSVVNDLNAEEGDRFKAAVAAAPYVHVRASDVPKGKKEAAQETAEGAATGVFAPRSGPRLVKG